MSLLLTTHRSLSLPRPRPAGSERITADILLRSNSLSANFACPPTVVRHASRTLKENQ